MGEREPLRRESTDEVERLRARVRELEARARSPLAALEGDFAPAIDTDAAATFLDNTVDLVTVVDAEGRFTYVNQAAKVVLGLDPHEAVGRLAFDFVHPDDAAATQQAFEVWVAERRSHASWENRQVSVSGEVRHVAWTIMPRYDADGVPISVWSLARDVTEQRAATRELEAAKTALEAVFDGIDDEMYVADPVTYELLHVNEAFKKTWGEDAVGKRCYELLHNEDAPCAFCTNDAIFGASVGKAHIWSYRNKLTGRWRRCTDKAIPWMDGRLLRFQRASDLTPLKETEASLRAVFDGIDDVIYVADPESYELLHVNGAFEKIWGSGVIGRKCYEVIQGRHTPCPFCTNDKIFGENVGRSHVWEFQNEITKQWFRCADKAIPWTDGRMVRFELATEITAMKETQADLVDKASALERSNQELEQFAYVASHDLQEPLRMVASFTQLLAKRYAGKLDDKADQYIGFAVDGAKRMQGLIDDLLALSRVGTRAAPMAKMDCSAVVADVLQSLAPSIDESGAEVVVGPLPQVLGDRSQLGQVFQNLISNAIKFRSEAAPRIEIGAERQGDEWVFAVADNGIGIDPTFQERIFVIFQRLHGREAYTGSGIGLSIVKKIIERHGGRIRVESAAGCGAQFIFTLPVVGGPQLPA